MASCKFSITLDTEKRKKMEELASKNYRSLSGEINMAIDLYIQQVTMGAIFVQSPVVTAAEKEVQEEQKEEVLTIDSFSNEEVDEF